MSRRLAILQDFVDRLACIQTARGYRTDAGHALYVNETPGLGEDDPEVAIALMVGIDTVRGGAEAVLIGLPLEVQAHAKDALEDAWITAELVLEDIKRAIELADEAHETLHRKVAGVRFERGSTRVVPREAGSTTVGVGVTYVVPYKERWGNP